MNKRYLGADYCINKPFNPKEVVVLVQTYLKQVERAENTSPLTGLPNEFQVNNEITELIEQGATFAVLYLDLADLKSFNRAYGFDEGDRAIQLLAKISREAVQLFGNPDDLVGHLGGDNFAIISTTDKARILCRRVISDFDSRVRTLYKKEDLRRGHIEYESHSGNKEHYPIMSLHVAVVANEGQTFQHQLEMSELAAEQIDYLKRYSGSKCYLDVSENILGAESRLVHGSIPQPHPEEMNGLHGVLTWVTFLASEIDSLVTVTSDCLKWVESEQKNLTPQQANALKTVHENVNQLTRLMEGLYHLARSDRFTNGASLEEVDIKGTLEWVMRHLKGLIEERKVTVDIKGIEDICHLMADERYLAQGLFYLLRSEVQASVAGDSIMMRLWESSDDLITITVVNLNHHIPDYKLTALSEEPPENTLNWSERGDLSLAKVLLKGIGGEIDIKSAEEEGTLYTVFVPKVWQSSLEEVKALRSAAEISRTEAETQIDTISDILASSSEQIPAGMNESIENLRSKAQELSVLCNRSLFTADDLSRRFEAQQEQLLQQEVTYLTTLEAFLSLSKVIARSMNVNFLFDLDSAQQVAKYALAIADEFRLSKGERQALHYSALLKDIALVSSPQILVDRKIVPDHEDALALKRRFNLVWKSLSQIPFLSSALVLLHMSESYDGTSGSFESTHIPTGARILAVADAFHSMVSGLSPEGRLDPDTAMQRLIADPIRRFDPDVVNTFAKVWTKNKLVSATNKSKWGDTVDD